MQDQLNGPAIDDVTYPAFVTTPNGRLLFALRTGRPGNGTYHLYEYNNGAWATLGEFISGEDPAGGSNTRSAYPNGLTYGPRGALHVTWCWRAIPPEPGQGALYNQDLLYAFSTDDGRTWRNTHNEAIATTGSNPIRQNSAGIRVWEVPQQNGLINTEGQTIDSSGRVHVIMRDSMSGSLRWFHYTRGPFGAWAGYDTGLAPAGRAKIVTAPGTDDAFILGRQLRIYGAAAAGGYSDWDLVNSQDAGRFTGDALYDAYRVTADGTLTVTYQHTTSSHIYILNYGF